MQDLNYKILFIGLLLLVFFGTGNFAYSQVLGKVMSTVKISVCGNNIKDSNETCDGTDLAGKTCQFFGFTHGTLTCSPACDKFITVNCYTPPTPPAGGGGGGGGGITPPPPVETKVNVLGRAFPLSKITILKDGQIAVTTISGPDAIFSASISGLTQGNYVFSVYAEDELNYRSSTFNFPLYITSGVTTNISGVFISPSIATDRDKVRQGDSITFFGYTSPNSEISITVNSEEQVFLSTRADNSGVYLYNFNTAPLTTGQHSAKARAGLGGELTPYSQSVGFLVQDPKIADEDGDRPIIPPGQLKKADLNNDGKVDLVDFSIAAFWYKRPLTENFKKTEKEKLNGDGQVDLVDFSIMAYHWTG